MQFSRAFARYFPIPKLLLPRAAGVDITDSSIKWVVLTNDAHDTRVSTFGSTALAPGIVVNGAVKDVTGLSNALRDIKKQFGGAQGAHAALPEEGAYAFSMHVPAKTAHSEIIHMIEFELEGRVPIPVSQAVYDFDTIATSPEGDMEIGVVAFSHELADGYAAAFEGAGIALLSLEIEARSIGRAISSSQPDEPITLLADAGKARTGFAILKRGVPIFTSTVEVGGGEMTRIVMEGLSLSERDAEIFKNEQGLATTDPKATKVKEGLEKIAGALAEEVARHYHFWDTRRNEHGERVTPVGQVYVVGGSANLRGLPDFIASRVHARTERPNVWRHIAAFDDYIPPIDRRASLQFVTAVGLAMRSV